MKTLFATLAAATAVAAIGAPAAAQSYDRGDRYDRESRYERSYDHDGRYERGYEQGYRRGHDRDGRDAWRHDGGAYNINARQAQLHHRIEAGLRRGTLTLNEARNLRFEAHRIARLEIDFRRGGLNWNERAELDDRLDRLEVRIARESRDRDYGWNHYRRRD